MRVIVADDDVLLRAGPASLLGRSGFAVAGQAGDAEELLDLVRTHAPDQITVDIRMPPTHTEEGLEAARAIREEFPHIAILLLSAHIEVEHARELLAVFGPREREVLALIAEGRSNTGIAGQLWVTQGTVEKPAHSILTKLALPETDDDHGRVLAVVTLSQISAWIVLADRDDLAMNPAAGVSATSSKPMVRSRPCTTPRVGTGSAG